VLVHVLDRRAQPLGAVLPVLPTQPRVVAAGMYVWTATASRCHLSVCEELLAPADARHSLTDLRLDNGMTCVHRAVERLRTRYHDPDGGDLRIDLEVTCLSGPFTMHTHFDQATRAVGSIVIDGETIAVDCVGFRDARGVCAASSDHIVGPADYASYSWGTTADDDGFFSMCGDFAMGRRTCTAFLRRDGESSPIASGTHQVLQRSMPTAIPHAWWSSAPTRSDVRSAPMAAPATDSDGTSIQPVHDQLADGWSLDGVTAIARTTTTGAQRPFAPSTARAADVASSASIEHQADQWGEHRHAATRGHGMPTANQRPRLPEPLRRPRTGAAHRAGSGWTAARAGTACGVWTCSTGAT